VGESELEGNLFSASDFENASKSHRFNLLLKYQRAIATGDEGGITNVEESATDGDIDFKSLLRGLAPG
jgi:hypothetical protein